MLGDLKYIYISSHHLSAQELTLPEFRLKNGLYLYLFIAKSRNDDGLQRLLEVQSECAGSRRSAMGVSSTNSLF